MLIPSVAVTVSLLGALGVMYLLGFSLDNLSLMALTVSTGFVVDDAIVVLENVTRHVEAGMDRLEAALLGAREVGFTVLSISISLVAVFMPILLMGGIVGRLFREFAITLSAAVLVSLVISLTTTPMMCAFLIDRPTPQGARAAVPGPDRRAHRRLDAAGLRARARLVAGRRPAHAGGAGGHHRASASTSTASSPRASSRSRTPARSSAACRSDQSSSFPISQQRLRRFVSIVRHDPSVQTVVAFAGSNAAGGFLFTTLKPRNERKGGSAEVVARLRPKLAHVVGAALFLNPVQDVRVGGRQSNATYQYTLQAQDLTQLREWASKLAEAMKLQPALTDVNTDQEDHALDSFVTVDHDKAARLGLTNTAIDNTLYDAFGQRQVSTIYKDTNQYRVIMEADPRFTQDPTSLNNIYVSTGAAASGISVAPTPASAVGLAQPSGSTSATRVANGFAAPTATPSGQTPSTLAANATKATAAQTAATSSFSTSTSLLQARAAGAAPTTTTAASSPFAASGNVAGQPGALAAGTGQAVAVGATAVAGPTAPPGRAASQGVAISTTPETLVPLSAFAHWADASTPTSVNHQDTSPATTDLVQPRARQIAQRRHQGDRPGRRPRSACRPRCTAASRARPRCSSSSLASEPILIAAALVAIYLVLGILYESYIHPLTVLSTLPSAGVGAVIALILFHIEFSIIALIGVILLIGIVKKNAILMIDFAIAAERERGTVAARRHPPGGADPLPADHDDHLRRHPGRRCRWPSAGAKASELRRPLGVTIIGGLLVSQVITLLTTPVVYLYLDRLGGAAGAGAEAASPPRPDPAPAV